MNALLSQKELTPSQRTERVKKILMNLRYPRMCQREKEFEEKRRALNLLSGITLRPQPFVEGKGVRVEFQFETVEEYQAILSYLSRLADKKGFQELFENKHQITSTKSQINSN